MDCRQIPPANGAVLLGGREMPVAPKGVPVELVRMSAAAYVLTVDGEGGVRLEAAEF